MKAAALLLSLVLGGCATQATVGTQVPAERLSTAIVPGQTTRAELLATFGKTKTVVFDSGYESWLYQSPAGNGRFSEFVVLIDPRGIVARTRQRAPAIP